jgi:hypothetical protein
MEDTRVEVSKKISGINKESKVVSWISKFLFNPFLAGITGFTLFFLFAILVDFLVNLFNTEKVLTIDIFTVLIGIAGFLLAFGFSVLESTQKDS